MTFLDAVFMGMGEPLLNLPSVLRAHEVLLGDVGIGARHITISTVGKARIVLTLYNRTAMCRLSYAFLLDRSLLFSTCWES